LTDLRRGLRSHLAEETMIRLLDGELGRRDRANAEKHIESCWRCRQQLRQFSSAMDRFAAYDAVIAEEPDSTPPRNWLTFSSGLSDVAATASVNSAPAFSLRRLSLLVPAASLIIVLVALSLVPVSTVSANEVYKRSAASERELLARTGNPLIEQRVQVESENRTAVWSVWLAPAVAKKRELWDGATGPELQTEIKKLYLEHGLNPDEPVSAFSYAQWRRSLKSAEDVVSREDNLLRVVTRNNGPQSNGAIVEARISVRERDWHAVETSFTVAGPAGNRSYRLREASYHVSPLDAENARVFNAPLPGSATVASNGLAIHEDYTNEPAKTLGSSSAPALPLEVEIEALARLRDVGADRQDSAQVEREGSVVRVVAYPENSARAALLERSLRGISGLVLKIHPLSSIPASGSTAIVVSLRSAPLLQPLFLEELTGQTGSTAAANLFASRQIELLGELAVEASAAKALASRFPRALEDSLSEPVRKQLDALALDHLNGAEKAWTVAEASSGSVLAAMGIPDSSIMNIDSAACDDWRSRSSIAAEPAHRLTSMYSRAFTLSGSSGGDQLSRESLREEVVILRAALARAFSGGCLAESN